MAGLALCAPSANCIGKRYAYAINTPARRAEICLRGTRQGCWRWHPCIPSANCIGSRRLYAGYRRLQRCEYSPREPDGESSFIFFHHQILPFRKDAVLARDQLLSSRQIQNMPTVLLGALQAKQASSACVAARSCLPGHSFQGRVLGACRIGTLRTDRRYYASSVAA